MNALIYILCAATALLCALLLLRAWSRGAHRLLLWSGLCFIGLSINNILLTLDRVVLPDVDLMTWRQATALVAMLPLLYGLIWEDD
jgi:hydrogenase/urease accessory protein HupE